MIIAADENIPFACELFSHLGEVRLFHGRTMSNDNIADADILLVRSVTNVNQAILAGSKVKFVGTCTIGTDHLDKNYLQENNISYSSAPGCNAHGVVQYVLGAMAKTERLNTENRVAIVGCGNVGGRIYNALNGMGIQCYCIDPFKSQTELSDIADFNAVYNADVICVHTPLIRTGPHPTFKMFDAEVLGKLKSTALILNAGRGNVIDNNALLNRLGKNDSFSAILDVWQDEPNINLELLDALTFATPHIAGYSYEGRVNGSFMIYHALCRFLNIPNQESNSILANIKAKAFGDNIKLIEQNVLSAILKTYDIAEDDKRLKNNAKELPAIFDRLRKTYPKRREFSHYTVSPSNTEQSKLMAAAGFSII